MDPRIFSFGFGRRICPGKELADESVVLAITMVLAVFNIRKARDASGNVIQPNVEFDSGLASRPHSPLYDVRLRNDGAARLVCEMEINFPWKRVILRNSMK